MVAAEGALSVALDVSVSAELAAEGTAREIVSAIQGVRRDIGLEVSDRIQIVWHTDSEELAAAMAEHQAMIAGELLATSVGRASAPQPVSVDINGETLTVELKGS